jgi:hypothetical protein
MCRWVGCYDCVAKLPPIPESCTVVGYLNKHCVGNLSHILWLGTRRAANACSRYLQAVLHSSCMPFVSVQIWNTQSCSVPTIIITMFVLMNMV